MDNRDASIINSSQDVAIEKLKDSLTGKTRQIDKDKTMKINILGTDYEFILDTLADNKRYEECAGYCDALKKEIHVRHYTKDDSDNDEFTPSSCSTYEDKNIRHEIIHAFMYESGLWSNSNNIECWAMNEEMVDWFAIQMPKIMKVYEEIIKEKTS